MSAPKTEKPAEEEVLVSVVRRQTVTSVYFIFFKYSMIGRWNVYIKKAEKSLLFSKKNTPPKGNSPGSIAAHWDTRKRYQ